MKAAKGPPPSAPGSPTVPGGHSRLARVATTIIAISLFAACSSESDDRSDPRASTGLPAGDDTMIKRHIDGDTIGVEGGISVRLIGVDTPETRHPSLPVECFGREASKFIAELLPIGTEVRLAYDVERRDRFDRTLAYLYRASDGLFVNAELVRQGYAQVATFPPNVAHADEFVELQSEARAEWRGLWSECPPNIGDWRESTQHDAISVNECEPPSRV